MPVPNTLIIGFLLGISALRYHNSYVCIKWIGRGSKILSFVIGAIIVTIFVELLNDTYLGIHNTDNGLLLIIPLAFTVTMFIERHIHTHGEVKSRQAELNSLINSLAILSGLFIGIITGSQLITDINNFILLIFILTAYDLIKELSLHSFKNSVPKRKPHEKLFRIIIAATPILGYCLVKFFVIPQHYIVSLLAIFSGALLYVTVRETLPHESEIKPVFFMSGAMIAALIFILKLYN